ncbi:NAD-dependent 4,6-dehydratase LegB [Desulforegula conservatrix]|uniref:NAD-dependent 4,6-dehydratase LegB n=1 Tax=Desulforegula conservatrix TaxID=153026 RepID=UPI00040513AC|nr:NAD-dependent 4,6-dehydratase LegB [Desulforegula conservatrix]
MKALVTGAGGFIGSHLCEALTEKGYEVRAFLRYNSRGNRGWLEKSRFAESIEFVTGDIRDYDSVRSAVKGADMVFHLSSLIGIPYSYRSPLAYVKTNVEGAYNVLEAAREYGVSKLIHTSTSEVYGTARTVPISEAHPIQPQSPYSASKIGADALAFSYFASFGLPVVIARPFNTYGPRQSARAIIPTIITQILSGMKKIKLGNLSPTRDLNYVEDTCRGFIDLAECDKAAGETVNIGSGREISIGGLVDLIKELMASDVEIITDDERIRPDKSEVMRLLCDNSRINELTGFTPSVSLKDGLKRTIDWLKIPENLSQYKADIYNV